MCGLLVILERGRPVDEARARAALASIAHRGPDHSGLEISSWQSSTEASSQRTNIALGHRRLSILDLNTRANQPFTRGPQSLVYNGEIYNFRLLRDGLSQVEPFTTDSDTEVLLRLVAERGLAGLAHANGMWAFACLDRAQGRLIAARDRFGKKPLFYFADGSRVILASEMRAIHTYLGTRPRMKPQATASFLAHGWLMPSATGETHVEGIREVPPGHALTIDLGSLEITSHDWAGPIATWGSPAAPSQNLPDLLRDCVRARLVSDRKIGLLLSGGIDSSLVMAVLADLGALDAVTCYIGDAGKSEDAAYAKACADKLGVTTTLVPLSYGRGAFPAFLSVCKHQEKPYPLIGNVLGMPALYSRIAEDDVRVVLDGTGGDEIFGGYYARYLPFAVRDAQVLGDAAWLSDLNAEHRSAGQPSRDSIDAASRPFLAGETLAVRSTDPLAEFSGTFDQALALDSSAGRMQEWLWQNDRNAMASSVENRSPLLDFRLTAYLGTGYAAKFAANANKLELRHAFQSFPRLPTEQRFDKQGFRWVFARFMRENRRALIDLIADCDEVTAHIDRERFIDAITKDDELIFSDLAQRAVSVAGVASQL